MLTDNTELLLEYGPFLYEGDLVVDSGTNGGDLIARQLDLTANDWATNLNISIMRRLNTAQGSIASMVIDTTGLNTLNASYGNPCFRLLSEPLNSTTISGMREGVRACLLQEDRINVLTVDSSIDSTGLVPFLVLTITYMIAGTNTQGQLKVIANRTLGVFVGAN